MPIQFTRVQPGDLILADQWNTLLEAVEKLGDRVAALEQFHQGNGGSLAIFGISTDAPYHVGDRITVIGRNFATPATNNVVTIDGTRVTGFRFGSSATQLVFDVPDIPGLPAGGKPVTLQISNTNGSADFSFNLEPKAVVPTGRVEVLYTEPPVMTVAEPNITAGQSYVFTFDIKAFVTTAGQYQVDVTTDQSGWSAELLEGDTDNPASTNILPLPGVPSGASQTIRVRVNVAAAGGSASAMLTVAVAETTTGTAVNPGNKQIDIAVGSPPPTPDNRVRVSLRKVTAATIVGRRVQFTANTQGAITFNLSFTEDGQYEFHPSLSAAAGWQINTVSIPGVTIQNAPANQDVTVFLTPGAAAPDADLIFSVTSSASPPVDVSYRQAIGIA